MAMKFSGTKRTTASRLCSDPDTTARGIQLLPHHVLTCSIRYASLTLRASLTLAAHRDRVLSSLAAIPAIVHPLVWITTPEAVVPVMA
jgi:hypothetical protein